MQKQTMPLFLSLMLITVLLIATACTAGGRATLTLVAGNQTAPQTSAPLPTKPEPAAAERPAADEPVATTTDQATDMTPTPEVGGEAASDTRPVTSRLENFKGTFTGAEGIGLASDAIGRTAEDQGIIITFEDNRVTGFAGCNRFTASYAIEGSQVEVGAVSTTRRLCDEETMQRERAFVDALSAAESVSFVDGELLLSFPDGVLRFTASGD